MTRPKWVGIALGMVVLTVAVWFLVRPAPETRLPDGSVWSVEWISYGKTNVYVGGSVAQKVFGSLFQKFGIRGFVKPPTREVFSDPQGLLSVHFGYKSIRRQSYFDVSYSGSKAIPYIAVADARTGYRYFQRTFLPPAYTCNYQDMYAFVHLTAFPRRQRYLQFDLHDGEGKLLGQISVRNPGYQGSEPVSWAESPTTMTTGDMEVTFGPVELPENAVPAIDTPLKVLNVKVSRHGLIATNWQLTDFTFRDAYGNHEWTVSGGLNEAGYGDYWRFDETWKTAGVGWQQYAASRNGGFLDPAHAWKVQFNLTQDAGFTTGELCTFDVSYPLTKEKIEVCRERELHVGFSNMLSIALSDTNANVRLTFVEGVDEGGTRLFPGLTGALWNHQHFCQYLLERHLKPGALVRVTVAIHTNYVGEYVFTPRKVAQKTPH